MCQLNQRHVLVYTTCPVCKGGDETVFHALVTCSFAAKCWEKVLQYRYDGNIDTFIEWFTEVLGSNKWCVIAMMYWGIWKARNETVWQWKSSQVNSVYVSTMQHFEQWKQAQVEDNIDLSPLGNERDGASHWVTPQIDIIKVSVDAAIFEEHYAAGIGIIARNLDGEMVPAKTSRCWGVFSPEMAEIMAIKEALSWIKTKDWRAIEMESDCLGMVQTSRVKHCSAVSKPSANMIAYCLATTSYPLPDRAGVMFLLMSRIVF